MNAAELVLASRSPRRARLLRDAGYRFRQIEPPFDDPAHPEPRSPAEAGALAAELADRKARSLLKSKDLSRETAACVVLAADTICVRGDGALIGQPASAEQARRMIRDFADAAHQVVTGVAIAARHAHEESEEDGTERFFDTAVVSLGHLADDEIERYVDSGRWRGKAGGYNLFERRDAGWPLTVEGDPTTVVGLPMNLLREPLSRRGVVPRVRTTDPPKADG